MKLAKADLRDIFVNFFNVGLYQLASMMLQFLTFPIIIRKYGLETFGEIALTTSIAYLIGNFINYGTNQTEINSIATMRNDTRTLSEIFSNVLWLRASVLVVITIVLSAIIIIAHGKSLFLWLSVSPIIIAEVINPLFFIVGIQKIHWISWGNIAARSLSFILITSIFLYSNEVIALNLFVGIPLFVFYLLIVFFLVRKFNIKISFPNLQHLRKKAINNFQVTFNGNIGMLQQSIFLFFVAGNFNTTVLGAYGIVDKLLNAIRQLVSAFSTATYPRGALLFHESKFLWISFRSMIQRIYLWGSVLLGLFLYFFADQIVFIISNEPNQLAVDFIKLLAPASLFLSLNANNILDFLLNQQYKGMFRVSLFILLSTVLLSYILSSKIFSLSIGYYPLLIEIVCYLIYSLAVKKYKLHAI